MEGRSVASLFFVSYSLFSIRKFAAQILVV